MKKRLVSIIVVMVLLVSVLSGCGLFTLDAERDGAQVVANIDVDGMKAVVTKGELIGMFNQVGPLYIQYYGMSAEEVINNLVTQLSNKEILVLTAMKDIADKQGIPFDDVKAANNRYVENNLKIGTNKYDIDIRQYDMFNFFTDAEKVYVVKQTKKAFKDSYDALVKEVEAEFAANKPEEENKEDEEVKPEEEKDTLEPRTQKTLTPAAGFDKTITYTEEQIKAELDNSFFDEMDAKFAEMSEVELEAYKRFKDNLVKGYETVPNAWLTMLDNQKEARLLEKYREEYVEQYKATTDQARARYNLKISQDLKTIVDEASYKAAIDADKTNDTLVHIDKKDNDYFMVKSILLSFSEDQKKALEAIKGGFLGTGTDNKQAIADARDLLATDKDFKIEGSVNPVGGIKVNVSNPYYDKDAVCEEKNCPCVDCANNEKNNGKAAKNKKCDVTNCPCEACVNHAYTEKDVPFEDILFRMSKDLFNSKDIIMPEAISGNATLKGEAELNAKMDMFDDYIYLVNDDPGMFNSTGYAVNTKGASQFVPEYVALARELAKKGVGAVGGVAEGYVNNPVVDEADVDKEAKIFIHSYVATDENGNVVGEPINYIVNDFGIHIVMVTYVGGQGEDTTLVKADEEKGDQYVINFESKRYMSRQNIYVTDEKGKIVLKDGKKQLKEMKNLTIEDKFKKTITDELQAEKYADYEKSITDAFKDSDKLSINDKVLNKIIKDIRKELGDAADGHNHDGHNH